MRDGHTNRDIGDRKGIMNLSELILAAKGDEARAGMTWNELSRRCGGKPAPKAIQKLALEPRKNFPDPDTIEGLARGLGVTQMTVIMAAAESLGLQAKKEESSLLALMPTGTDKLTPEKTTLLLSIVRDAVDEARRPTNP